MITCIKGAYWRGEISLQNKHIHVNSGLFSAGGDEVDGVMVGGQTAGEPSV